MGVLGDEERGIGGLGMAFAELCHKVANELLEYQLKYKTDDGMKDDVMGRIFFGYSKGCHDEINNSNKFYLGPA